MQAVASVILNMVSKDMQKHSITMADMVLGVCNFHLDITTGIKTKKCRVVLCYN